VRRSLRYGESSQFLLSVLLSLECCFTPAVYPPRALLAGVLSLLVNPRTFPSSALRNVDEDERSDASDSVAPSPDAARLVFTSVFGTRAIQRSGEKMFSGEAVNGGVERSGSVMFTSEAWRAAPLAERGSITVQSHSLPSTDCWRGFSLASMRVRLSFLGLRVWARDAHGRDGRGFSLGCTA